jgi:ribosomal protein S18 acetylase RimI-like enzyme
MSATTSYRVARDADIPAIARLHHAVIRGTLYARMGRSFLEELYRLVLAGPHTCCWVAEEGGCVVGFLSMAWDLHRAERTMRRGMAVRWQLAAALHLLLDPREILALGRHRRLLWAIRHQLPRPYVDIMTLGVAPRRQGCGIGRGLLAQLDAALEQRSVATVHVDTPASNSAAVAFYRRCGFTPVGTHGGFSVLARSR